MIYELVNDELKVKVDTNGAEIISVINKKDGRECMWNADPDVWNRHAPILFPYTGKLPGGKMLAKGMEYSGGQHGFARDMEHKVIESSKEELVLELASDDATRKLFPYDFVLRSVYTLKGNTIDHMLEVTNPEDAEDTLMFGIGYHPGFVCPFDSEHDTEDYEFRFDKNESPIVINTQPGGFMDGKYFYLGMNIDRIQLTDNLFDNDSLCMSNLRSSTLGIYEKNSDRAVICNIREFPYCLIWSKDTEKVKFVCIEPWHSVTALDEPCMEWEKREHAAKLNPGQVFSTVLSMTFC